MFSVVEFLLDVVVGLGLLLVYATAFFGWLIFPLLPLLLLFTLYIAVRYSAAGLALALRHAGQLAADVIRGAARSAALWVLSHVPEPSH